MRCSALFSRPNFEVLFAIFISWLTCVNEAASENPRTEERFTAAQAREMVLTRAEGSEQIDNELRMWQQKAAAAPTAEAPWQKLGELFIAKARLSGDPGFYKLADEGFGRIPISTGRGTTIRSSPMVYGGLPRWDCSGCSSGQYSPRTRVGLGSRLSCRNFRDPSRANSSR
jgi:hypothetical protein